MELGAGIRRFTGELVKKAGHVIALNFIENVTKKVPNIVHGHKTDLIIEYYVYSFMRLCEG